MKIVHINSNDISGGAARAAYRLHKGLQRVNHDSVMLVGVKSSDDPSVILFRKPMDPLSVAGRGLRHLKIGRDFRPYVTTRPKGLEIFSDDRSPFASTLLSQVPESDVVNLHWIPGLVDYSSALTRLVRHRPVVWTLHDMNPFTGGCHYDLGCERFAQSCQECPQIGSTSKSDLSHDVWQRKQRALSGIAQDRLHIVSPSRWLGAEAKRSQLFKRFDVSVIPYGLDLSEFAPRPQAPIRELLGIDCNAKVLLFLAEELSNHRKGFASLARAIEQSAGRVQNLVLLSLGHSQPTTSIGVPWIHLGSLNNDRFLSMVYSAADLFAICSLQDNLPNTVLEAMACGVPVIGHRVGGIPDMVRDGINGVTVSPTDPDALWSQIVRLMNAPDTLKEMGSQARRMALDEYDLQLQARRYSELYASLPLGRMPA